MKTPHILAVMHGRGASKVRLDLLDQECRKSFTKKYAPRLDETTLLILEGRWTRTYIPNKWGYARALRRAKKELGEFAGQPALAWRDPRCRWFSMGNVLTIGHIHKIEEKIGREILPHLPAYDSMCTITDIALHASLGIPAHRIHRPLTPDELSHIIALANISRKFDEAVISAAREWSGDGRVFIVVGAAHAMSLWVRTGWPIDFLANYRTCKPILSRSALYGITIPQEIGAW